MSRYLDLVKKDSSSEEYFATKEARDCVSECIRFCDSYYSEMNRTGRINLYRNSYFKFFQGFILKGALYHSGQEGELVNMYANHYHNLIDHTVNMVCQQKLDWDPQTTVNDAEAQEQVRLAKGLLHAAAADPEQDIDGKGRNCVQMSRVFTESYITVLWNKDKGRTLATQFDEENENQTALREGDNEYEVWSPFDVIIDCTVPSSDKINWWILRRWENKYEIAARYPAWAKEVTGLSMGSSLGDTQLIYMISTESDIIPVYYFVHNKTSALPSGRLLIFIDDNVILADGELKYRRAPIFRMAESELWGSPFAYARSCDILPLQEAVDRLSSAIITNQLTFATQNIAVGKGASITWENLYGGLNLIEWDCAAGECAMPQALQLTKSPEEVFKFIDTLKVDMGTLMGVNDAIRGNADLILKGQASGAALALMTSNSIQFNSPLQKAYIRLMEQVGTATLHNIQDFGFPQGVNLKRKGMSLSATKKFFKTEYESKDLSKIDKVIIKYGNPLSQTTSGKMQIAETLIAQGFLKTPQEYLQVMETGSLEPLLESEEAQLHLIKEENELMLRGEVPQALWADAHALHIQEHLAIIANIEARSNPKILEAVQKHVQGSPQMGQNGQPVVGPDGKPVIVGGHLPLLKTLDPVLAGLMKQPVLSAPPAPPTGPPAPPNGAPGKPTIPVPAANGGGLPQKIPVAMPTP